MRTQSKLERPIILLFRQIKFIDCLVYAFERCHDVSKEYKHPHGLAVCAFPMFDYCMEEKNLLVNHHGVEVASNFKVHDFMS